MSSDVVIQAEDLGKRYRLGEFDPHRTFREAIRRWVAWPARKALGRSRVPAETQTDCTGRSGDSIWALRNVSFEVRRGEALGIVGHNGAGKSTLLKVLTRITKPTTGRARIWGRVGSLLEVGTGFHPELTGRENIFLNGAILGMSRVEIKQKFDEIAAFSGVERFLDTPVKRYSSGMRVRLGFSVAAHLNPEILLIDEVLAVGDVGFQKKCRGKMGDVVREGRTVVLVSHNMGAIASVCNRAVLLNGGNLISEGEPGEVISQYINSIGTGAGEQVWQPENAPGNDVIRVKRVRVLSGGSATQDVGIDRDVDIEVEYWNLKRGSRISCGIALFTSAGECVLWTPNRHSATIVDDEWFNCPAPEGVFRATCTIPANFLNAGKYYVTAKILTDIAYVQADVPSAISFVVHETGEMRAEYQGAWAGAVRPRLHWQTQLVEDKE